MLRAACLSTRGVPAQVGRWRPSGVWRPPCCCLSTNPSALPNSGRGLVARVRDQYSALALGGAGPALTPAAVRSHLAHAVGAVVGIVFLLACLATGSQDYETSQALLRCTQGLRRTRRAAAALLADLTSEERHLAGKAGRRQVCHICRPRTRSGQGGEGESGRATVVLLAEEGETSEEWALVAQELVSAGITCVLAHKLPVEDTSARRSLYSKLADIEEVVIGCDIEGPVVLVCGGTGTWAPLCYAGMYPDTVMGVVTAQPALFTGDNRLLWQQAVRESSKHAHHPKLLEEHTRPMAIDDGRVGAFVDSPNFSVKSADRLATMMRKRPQTDKERGDALFQRMLSERPVLTAFELTCLRQLAPLARCPVVAVSATPASVPVGLSLVNLNAVCSWYLGNVNLTGRTISSQFWDTLEEGKEVEGLVQAASAVAPQRSVAPEFSRVLASLPDTFSSMLGFGSAGWWAEAVEASASAWPRGFSPVFVREEDTVVLALQAPKTVAQQVVRLLGTSTPHTAPPVGVGQAVA